AGLFKAGFMVDPAVVAAGEERDGIDAGLPHGLSEGVRVESAAHFADMLRGVEVQVNLAERQPHGNRLRVRSLWPPGSLRPAPAPFPPGRALLTPGARASARPRPPSPPRGCRRSGGEGPPG